MKQHKQDKTGEILVQNVDFPKSVNNPIGDWFIRLVKGIIIGIGFILPGLSGGVLAVIFGMYDIIIRFLANLRRKFWEHVRFFIPVGLGGLIGIFLFSVVVSQALANYQTIAVSLFIGFVVGTFPSLYRKAGLRGREKSDIWLMVLIGLFFCAFMVFMGKRELAKLPQNIFTWFLSGALIGLGVIVPGMSPSNFLLYFGLYEPMTRGISNIDWSVIIPLGLGGLVCVLLLAKLVEWLFEKYYSKMYHLILGLVIGSTLAIFFTEIMPGFKAEALAITNMSFGKTLLLSILLFVIGTILSWLFSKVEDRYDPEKVVVNEDWKEES